MSSLNPSSRARLKVALAGQQNAGKSTLFNALTGARQHIANYPGVTVEKKSGTYADGDLKVEVVDLPGTYSLTSFSLEERVARDFLLREKPDVIVNVIDASTLERGLPLTFQLIEMGVQVVVVVNMIDVAERLGLKVDPEALAAQLGVPVIVCVGRRGVGIAELRAAVRQMASCAHVRSPKIVDYGTLEDSIADIERRLEESSVRPAGISSRWLALALLDGGSEAETLLIGPAAERQAIAEAARSARETFGLSAGTSASDHVIACRLRHALDTIQASVQDRRRGLPISERIDRVLLNRWLAPVFLLATIWAVYQLSIVQGYELTKVTWPLLASFRNWASSVLPAAGFLTDPFARAFGLWMVDSVNTLLNYVPIFLILFSLIAILEDSGYMARIAFILDRILKRFGLHGQSTLPMVLAGVFAGGCAVPGVMATKAIPDPRARLATILTVPFMNCLAKVPLYTLLISMFFPENKGLVLFYLSTITVVVALLVAKLLTVTVLRKMETAPFVMELPHYHLPTLTGVLRRAFDRTWLYIKKVGTIVVAVAAVIYVLLQFPGLSADRIAYFQGRAEASIAEFHNRMAGNPFAAAVPSQERLIDLINVYTAYRAEKLNAGGKGASDALDAAYASRHPEFVPFLLRRGTDPNARKASSALKTLADERKTLRREMKEERLTVSALGRIGQAMEPVTRFAGFDWRINVALLSSFAARESSVATLGVLFGSDDGEAKRLEDRMEAQGRTNYTPLTAVSVMLFFALYPPCLATMIMVRLQTASTRWMLFAIVFPTMLGLAVAGTVQLTGWALALDGLTTISVIYGSALALLVVVGLYRSPREVWRTVRATPATINTRETAT
ncbi:ferrous iron transport protein B [Blastochloris sulfoviridis]|uniref:Ferrous iron transport protein B n=1 Tax=Blastochloris sulfoviridis TaxID=50712 RepID=A0A5M6I1U1_9HYPH|nr:ferrous iron transport protein B [Blastochloris sulfoviridis]KAA5602170.1 ferrous iron transport protein B [Blastochloris sulfoviridis]